MLLALSVQRFWTRYWMLSVKHHQFYFQKITDQIKIDRKQDDEYNMAATGLAVHPHKVNGSLLILQWTTHPPKARVFADSKAKCGSMDIPGHCLVTGDRDSYKVM